MKMIIFLKMKKKDIEIDILEAEPATINDKHDEDEDIKNLVRVKTLEVLGENAMWGTTVIDSKESEPEPSWRAARSDHLG